MLIYSASTRSSDSAYDLVEADSVESPWSTNSRSEVNQGWPSTSDQPIKGYYLPLSVTTHSIVRSIIRSKSTFGAIHNCNFYHIM